MPVFVWEGTSRSGDTRKGEMNATSPDEVGQRLRAQDINVSKIRKKGAALNLGVFAGRVPLKNLVVFTRQFATMIDAGLPIVQCLELLGGAEPHKSFRNTIQAIRADVESGQTLAESMKKHPTAFDSLYCALVSAGEEAGILDTVMNRLAIEIEKSQKLRRKIRSAFSYPTIVLVIACAVVILLLYKVIPTFTSMFAEMGGGELPAPTQIVVNLSEFVQTNIGWIALTIVGTGMFFTWFMRTPATRAIFDRYILKAPLFGPLVRKASVARFTRTLGTMVSSGVPIVDSLEIVSKTSGNMTIEKAILHVRAKIAEGQNMVDPLTETNIFPHMVVQMIGVGESTGALDTMLNKIADFYEEEVDVAVDNLTSMIEPLLMVFLGIVVGGMLIAMYLPIFTMAGNIKKT
ncbi:MAG: type II secretion system F family protein [bacterium]